MAPVKKPEPAQEYRLDARIGGSGLPLADTIQRIRDAAWPQPNFADPKIIWGQVHLNAVQGAQSFSAENLGLLARG